MSSDEEILDDLLKSVMENEEESKGEVSEAGSELSEAVDTADILSEDDLADLMSSDDLADLMNAISDSEELQSDADMDEVSSVIESEMPEETDFSLDDLAVEDFAVMEAEANVEQNQDAMEDVDSAFVINDVGEVEADGEFAISDIGAEDLDGEFAINDIGEEEADGEFAISDIGAEDLDGEFAINDIGEEEADGEFAISDIGTEEADGEFAISDIGTEEADGEFAISDIGTEEADEEFAISDIGAEDLDSEFAISDFGEEESLENLLEEDDVDAIFAAADAAVSEEVADSIPHTEDDMLAMLESMSMDTEDTPGELSDGMVDAQMESSDKKGKSKKEKKGKKLGGKNKTAHGTDGENTDGNEDEAQAGPKKQSFFSKIAAFLMEADDDEEEGAEDGMTPSDENKNILAELDEEDKKKKKKKVKGKKGKEEEAADEENEDGEAANEKKEKKKKKKKEKAVAAEVEELLEDSKPKKKVSKKNVAVIAGLCLTMTAMIVVLCSIIPGFFDKRKARDAFYHSDYTKSYELLYGKKLDNSDTIIFNKSKIILELNRKLDAYHNYLALGKEVQALDALMAGIQKYPDIMLDAEEYHVTQEVDAIYETMLNIMNDKYGISEDMAKEIISYDDLTYTKKLDSIVNGTSFDAPATQDWSANEDLLPEEQAVVDSVVNRALEDVRVEEELPLGDSDTVSVESVDTMDRDDSAAGVNSEESQLPVDDVADSAPVQDTATEQGGSDSNSYSDTASDSQGQMIQGIRQPISVEIHGR